MALDTGVFDKIKTFQDYNKLDQAFQLQKQLQQQQIQTGGIDAASKANIYATQVLSAATATGDQGAYDNAKQHLAQNGIDISTWARDVQSGAQQAQAARLAQSPLGSLLNAGLKGEANNIAATQAMGSTGAGAQLDPLSQAVAGKVGLGIIGGGLPSQPKPAPIVSSAPPAQNRAMSQPEQNQAMSELYPNDAPAQPVTLSQTPQQATASAVKFTPPPQQPGETNQAYNQRVQTAFEAYKADPNYLTAAAAASKTGQDQAEASKAAVGANANYDQVVQTINGIKSLISAPGGLPQDRYGIPAGAKVWANQNFGDQKLANNANTFTKLNEAQTIGAIKELASTGQIRMTRTLENILNRGYLIDPGASDEGKKQQADVILAELNNSKIATQNVNTGMNGGPSAPYQQMPIAQPQSGVVSYQEYFK